MLSRVPGEQLRTTSTNYKPRPPPLVEPPGIAPGPDFFRCPGRGSGSMKAGPGAMVIGAGLGIITEKDGRGDGSIFYKKSVQYFSANNTEDKMDFRELVK